MSLRTKIALSFLLCIVFAFSPLLWLMNTQIKRLNMEHTEKQALTVVESKAEEISSWLNQRISELRIIETYPGCRTMDMESLKPYITELNAVLQDRYGNPAETFAVGGTDGLGWVSSDITIDVSEREYFRRAMETEEEYVISKPVVSKSDSNPIFLICYPIRSGGETVGFLNGSVNLDKITEIVNGMDVFGGQSWIMDRRGNIYSTAKNPFTSREIPPEILTEMSGTLEREQGGRVALEGRSLFYASVPLTGDWMLCSMVDDSAVFATTNYIIRLLAAACGIMTVVSCVLAVAISRTITRPLERLRGSMDRVSAGDLEAVFDAGSGADEISALGRTFNQMVGQIKELLDRLVNTQSQKRMAELRALQAQINPHFLYNTLDTLQWKALEKDNFEVADIVNSLSRFFRISLSDGRELITVQDEVRHAESYLEIQKVRYQDKISYAFQVDRGAEGVLIPKLLLQPLVENAIYHGLKPVDRPGHITVAAAMEREDVRLTVADDGAGMEPAALAALRAALAQGTRGDHYGLYNINERLALWYHGRAELTIESKAGQGTAVTVRLPGGKEEAQC